MKFEKPPCLDGVLHYIPKQSNVALVLPGISEASHA